MKVCVVGDACIDVYHTGDTSRKNPEASTPLLNNVKTTKKNGMALNVAENMSKLGAHVEVIIPNGDLIEKHRYVDQKHGNQYLRVDYDKTYKRTNVLPDPSKYHAVLVCDYNKGFLSKADIITLSQHKNVYIDTKKKDLRGAGDALFKINEHEFNALTHEPKNLLVTYGAKGAFYDGVLYKAESLEAVDVCGAGDTFLAALAFSRAKSNTMDKAIRFANLCAAITCTKRGTYAPTTKEVYNRHRWNHLHTNQERLPERTADKGSDK